jgi:hypothetical protein
MELHGNLLLRKIRRRKVKNLHNPPQGVDQEHHQKPTDQEKDRVLENPLEERDLFGEFGIHIHLLFGLFLRYRLPIPLRSGVIDKDQSLRGGGSFVCSQNFFRDAKLYTARSEVTPEFGVPRNPGGEAI